MSTAVDRRPWTPDKVGCGLRDYLAYRWHMHVDRARVQLFRLADESFRVEVTLQAGAVRSDLEADLRALLPENYRLVIRAVRS